MSFLLILALLFCFEAQGSSDVFGEKIHLWDFDYEYVNETHDLDLPVESFFYIPFIPAELTVDSVSNNSDSCNLTVTCSTEDSHISSTFKCDTQTCYQEGGEQTEDSWTTSLHLYLSSASIICNYSNHVNWNEDTLEIENFCPQHVGSESLSDGISICLVKTVVFSVGLIIMVFAVIIVNLMEKLNKQQ